MAVGKNKKTGKGKKGGKRKAADPFAKKEWYDVRTPIGFPTKSVGKTIATKTQGTKVARDTLMGRVFEASLGDLKPDGEDEAYRKFQFKVEDVQGFNCLTQFHGMSLTTDKLRSLVRKWQTLIEAYADVRTTDGYALRLFAIGFTKRRQDHQHRKTSYAQASQTRTIRKRMIEIMQREASSVDLADLVTKLQSEIIGREIEKHTQAIYPLQNCLIRKVKMLRAPKLDLGKLLEAHGGADAMVGPQHTPGPTGVPSTGADAPRQADTGAKVERPKPAAAAAAPAAAAAAAADDE